MECIDLRTGYMLLAFRSRQEVERAKTLCESRGIRVSSAIAYDDISESEAAGFVKPIDLNGQNLFFNYTNQQTEKLCKTAKDSLRTALEYVNALTGIDGTYLLLYHKEEPLLQSRSTRQEQPEAPVF